MLDKLLSFFSLKHDLYQKLKLEPEAKSSLTNIDNIDINGIFPFQRLSIDKSSIDIKGFMPNIFSMFSINATEVCKIADLFNPIFECKTYPSYPIDISEIRAFTESKDNLNEYHDVDTFIKKTRPHYVQPITPDKLAEMMAHAEITLINSPEISIDTFSIFGWSPKLAICNNGGSHHLAAAQYIAKHLNQVVPIEAKTALYTLNETALNQFNEKYTAFALQSGELYSLLNAFNLSELKFLRMRFNPVIYVSLDIYFFENTADNARIISLFKERYTCLNQVLANQIQYQNVNETFNNFTNWINQHKTAV